MNADRIDSDVLVAGGGIVGCSAALALAKKGFSVTLVESGACGAQASGVNFGGVRQQGRHPAELPLSRRARHIWSRLPALIGNDCEFRAIGHLRLARTPAQMEVLERYRDEAAGQGLKLELLDARALRRRYEWLSPALEGGSLCAEDGDANPRLVTPYFAKAAREHGVRVIEHAPFELHGFDGSRFDGSAGETALRAPWLINATGAWGHRLAQALGESVPLGVIYPNMLVTEPLARRIEHCLGVVGGGFYARQVPRGNVVIGGLRAAHNSGLSRSRAQAEVTVETLLQASACVPWLQGKAIIRTWSGIEGYFDDTLPVIGPGRTTSRALHAFGFSGHGFQLGPAVGEVLAELIADGGSPTPIAAFDIGRFSASGAAAGPSTTRSAS